MGIGDSIKNAAENAMKDLGGTAAPHDDGHVPEPGAPDEDIRVHSSISEASNTMEAVEDESRDGASGQDEPRPAQDARTETEAELGTSGNILPGGATGTPGKASASTGPGQLGPGQPGAGQTAEGAAAPAGDVPGPGGLPGPDPDALRADPTEADKDPSTGLGRG